MQITTTTKDAYQLIHEGALALQKASQNGMRIDAEYCSRKIEELSVAIKKHQQRFWKTKTGKAWNSVYGNKRNINADSQIQKILFETLKIQPLKLTATGKASVDSEVLSSLAKGGLPEIRHILKVRKYAKASDYLKGLYREQVDGILHPFFPLHLVKTFRSSSAHINFHNQPKQDKELKKLVRTAIYPRQGYQLGSGDFCLAKGTLIETIDGKIPIEVIVQACKKKDIYVYCFNHQENRIGVSKVSRGGLSKKKDKVWLITLDNGAQIKATINHKFLLRNREYCPVSDLKQGDSLMPFYQRVFHHKGATCAYREIYLNNGQRMFAHNLIALDVYKTKIAGSNLLVHHKDSNGCNNSLSNLEIMTRQKHMRIHSIQGWKNNPQGRVGDAHWMKTEKGRAQVKVMNAARKENWTKEDWEEFGSRVSEGIKRKGGWAGERNPMWGRQQSEEVKLKIASTKKGKSTGRPAWNAGLTKENSASVRKISIANKGKSAWNKGKDCPQFAGPNNPFYGKSHSEETKRKISKANKGNQHSLETRKKMSAGTKEYWRKKRLENHKVVSIEFCGEADTYNITVENHHNFALSAGVIVKNSGMEVRLAGIYTEDEKLIYDIIHGDMHRDMAQELYMIDEIDKHDPGENNLRQGGKNGFVFPEFYGDYYGNCAPNLLEWAKLGTLRDGTPALVHLQNKGLVKLDKYGNIKNCDKFVEHVKNVEDDFWHARYKKYQKWKEKQWAYYEKKGYVNLLTGFRCGGVMNQKQVVNYPIQGTAFHCLLWAFIELTKRIEQWNTFLIGQIHDEMVSDTDPKERDAFFGLMRQITCVDLPQAWNWINVPLEIEFEVSPVNGSWHEMKDYEVI